VAGTRLESVDPKYRAQFEAARDRLALANEVRQEMRAVHPALAVVDTNAVGRMANAPENNTKIYAQMSQGFDGMRQDMTKLSKTVQQDPSKALWFDALIPQSLGKIKDPAERQQAEHWAKQQLETLINGRGKGRLRNPEDLVDLVEKATKQKNPIGFVRELQLAAERVKQGHEVGLGLGADIVDYSAKEAIQLKNVTSLDEGGILGNLQKAGEQLKGSHGELVPKGANGKPFQRTAEIIIDNAQNPLYDKTPNQLIKVLQKKFKGNDVLQDHVDLVRIRAGDKVYEFSVSRSKAGEFQFINAASPKKLSELPQSSSTEMASESQSEGTIQVASQPPQDSQNQPEIG
jgi:hypothetical protein